MFNMFKKKVVKSNIYFTVKTKINMPEKELIQVQYITENYIVTEANGKLIYFSKEENDNFIVDEENKELKRIDISAQFSQIAQFKVAVGKIEVVKNDESINLLDLPTKYFSLKNSAEQVKFSGDIYVSEIKGFEKTLYSVMNAQQQEINVFKFDLKEDEIVTKMNIVITMGQNEQKQSTEILSIEPNIDNVEKYDNYITFKIKK